MKIVLGGHFRVVGPVGFPTGDANLEIPLVGDLIFRFLPGVDRSRKD